jgi:hypothetical protein
MLEEAQMPMLMDLRTGCGKWNGGVGLPWFACKLLQKLVEVSL